MRHYEARGFCGHKSLGIGTAEAWTVVLLNNHIPTSQGTAMEISNVVKEILLVGFSYISNPHYDIIFVLHELSGSELNEFDALPHQKG